MTVQVQTGAGTATTVHPAYTATLTLTGSSTTVSTVTIPNGTASVTITINDTKVEAVTVALVETSTTGLTPVAGTATFIVGTATQVVVVSTAEPAPYSVNSVVVTIQVRDASGNPQTTHAAYTATVGVNGSASVVGSPISIPNGVSSTTVTVNDAVAQTVNVTLTETSGTGLTEVNGTVVFQLDPPEAVITASSSVAPTGGAIDFDGSASFAEFPYVLLSYAWDFNGDGVVDSTLADPPPWTYAATGTYTVSLKVIDSGGFTDTSTMKVYVAGAGQPVGPITLTPSAWTMAADGASTITITSSLLADAYGVTVPDGTKVTVFTNRGALTGFADAGPEQGLQVGTLAGVITLVLKSGTSPGDAQVSAKSVSGASEGAVTIAMTGTGKAPFVVGFGPSGKATANPSQVTVAFSEEINAGTLNGFTFTVTGNLSGPVQGNVSYLPSTKTATFTIVGPMDVGTEVYTVVVSHGVQDMDGLGLDGNFNGLDDGGSDDFSFVFGALADGVAPSVTSVIVAPNPFSPDQDGVDDSTTITMTGVDVVRWQARVLSSGATIRTIVVMSGSAADWDGRDESGAVVDEGTYTIEITAWDAAGNASAPVVASVDVTSPLQFGSFGP
jgi:PKD repeat protein